MDGLGGDRGKAFDLSANRRDEAADSYRYFRGTLVRGLLRPIE
jgi:hypothetical protein